MSLETTLQERGTRYGDFTDHAKIAQDLQDVMRRAEAASGATAWTNLTPVQKQALTVIADKIARILSGDPNYADNWHDIQGYARLVEERLPVVEAANSNEPPIVQLKRLGELPPAALRMIRSHVDAELLRSQADEMQGVKRG